MRFGLDEKTIQQITSVLARYPQVEKALLYGSRAKGTYKTGSDIDLTLLGDEALTLEILYRIMDDLDDLLLPYSFDLSLFHDIEDPEVVEHIQRIRKVFYEKRTTKP